MSIWYVHRDAGIIVWAGQYLQLGYATEALDDAISVELQTFLNPPITPDQDLQQRLVSGCQIISAGAHPQVTGTWSLDATTQQQITTVATSSAQFGLPRGLSTFTYPDFSGTPHALTIGDVGVLFVTLRDFIDELYETAAARDAGFPFAPWPAQPVNVV